MARYVTRTLDIAFFGIILIARFIQINQLRYLQF